MQAGLLCLDYDQVKATSRGTQNKIKAPSNPHTTPNVATEQQSGGEVDNNAILLGYLLAIAATGPDVEKLSIIGPAFRLGLANVAATPHP